ncbi:hypothetical protein TcYC6_0031150 [Trypanosoma cruzi]|uniref:Uncharacterized protein n=1 Tax=Trypanosoma cruzi TaxID=5693 RepID=A0A7J6YDT5_TRYCR|nr:hypothetical protein ECC02_002046 [Trypanosoma cruzi]KAF8285679.1 hypothetical protein TcYC6_0031150 [Trypanosoma cruzi]
MAHVGRLSPAKRRQRNYHPTSRMTLSDPKHQRPSPFFSSSSSSSPSSAARPTPLVLALQAQWSLLQQHLQLGAIPISAERDLLKVLESLPENKNTILSDVEGVLPYILAFAVAPIPSERTQVIALGAMQAIVGSLITVWGKKAAAVLVHDFLTVEHNALHALGVTLSVALEDGDTEGVGDVVMELNRVDSGKKMRKGRNTTLTETRSSIIGGALELLMMMVSLSTTTAAAALTHPKLLHAILSCLPQATPTQACDVANIFLALGTVDGAAEVLVASRAYHGVLHYIRMGARVGVGVSHPNATVTALCLFLKFVVRLAGNPAAFAVLQEYSGTPHVMEELLCGQWGELVATGCQWLIRIMEQHTTQCVGFISDLLLKTRVGEQLSSMLLWPSSMATYAALAALCWRWFSLVSPATLGSFLVSNPNALFSLVQSLATTSLTQTRRQQQQEGKQPLLNGDAASGLREGANGSSMVRQMLTEIVCALGICYGLANRELRAAIHRVVFCRLSPVTQEEVQKRVRAILAGVDDSYFEDEYPTVMVPRRNPRGINISLPEKNLVESSAETDDDDDDHGGDATNGGNSKKTRPLNDAEGVRSLSTGKQWRSFMLHALTRLFRGNARGTVKSGSMVQGHPLGAATGLHRMPNLHGARQNPQNNHAVTATAVTTVTSSIQLGVVQRAEQMGGTFYLDSIRVILRLAHHYKHASGKEDFHGAAKCRSASAHSVNRGGKAPNPWAPPEKVESTRRWGVEEVRRSDVVLFFVSYDNIVAELAEALEAVEEHTRNLGQQLQVCPTRALHRRCVLNDLYLHVYPSIHMFLRFIQHHMARSRPVLQVIAESERAVHSGNILDLYEAVGHCVGASVSSPGNTTIESQ